MVVLDRVHQVEDHPADPVPLGGESVAQHCHGPDEQQEDGRPVQHATLKNVGGTIGVAAVKWLAKLPDDERSWVQFPLPILFPLKSAFCVGALSNELNSG